MIINGGGLRILKRIMLSRKGGLAVKKFILPILILVLIAFFTAGCGKEETSKSQTNDDKAVSTVENKVSDSQSPDTKESASSSPQNSSSTTSSSTLNSVSTTNASNAASTAKMQDVSNLMDQVDTTLKGLDNSSDISNLESTISNIK